MCAACLVFDGEEAELFGSDVESERDFYNAAIDDNAVQLQALLDGGQSVNHLSPNIACERPLPDAPDILLSNIAQCCSALFLAALHGCHGAVQLLLSYRADVSLENVRGQTAVHAAAFHNEARIIDVLLQAGAPLWPKDRLSAASPLQLAACEGHLSSVATLLAAGAPINVGISRHPRTFGTPLQLAAQNGHLAVAKVLVANTRLARPCEWTPGSEPERNRVLHGLGSAASSTARDLAERTGHLAVARFLQGSEWKPWLRRRLWRRAGIVVRTMCGLHARAVERLYRPGGDGYAEARADFQARALKRQRTFEEELRSELQ